MPNDLSLPQRMLGILHLNGSRAAPVTFLQAACCLLDLTFPGGWTLFCDLGCMWQGMSGYE